MQRSRRQSSLSPTSRNSVAPCHGRNIDVVRESWDAWLRGDLDGVLASYAPDSIWEMHFRDWPERPYVGPGGVRRFLSEWLEVWDAFEVGVDEFLVGPDGRVLALAWQRGRGRHSGLAMDMKWGQVVTVRDGEIIRVDNYEDRGEAFKAVGLSHRADST
jgi:ketosteroid isomerase-like protein